MIAGRGNDKFKFYEIPEIARFVRKYIDYFDLKDFDVKTCVTKANKNLSSVRDKVQKWVESVQCLFSRTCSVMS